MRAFLVDREDKPGELARCAEAIAAKGVNITTVAGTTCDGTGRLAMATDDEGATRTALSEIQCTFQEKELVQTRMRHEPGTLATAARRLAEAGVNVEALLPMGMDGTEVVVGFVASDPARARETLTHAGMASS